MSAASGATAAARGALLLRRAAFSSSVAAAASASSSSSSSSPLASSSATAMVAMASSARPLSTTLHRQEHQRRAAAVPPPLRPPQPMGVLGLATSTSTSADAGSSSSSISQQSAVEAALPHLQRPTDEELAAMDLEDEETSSNMKDGLAIKMATSTFAGRRRFYQKVGVRARAEEGTGAVQHWEVTLDGYPLKTPGTEKPYRLPTRGLALAVALEWDQQVTYKGVEPTYMPITGMATIALDEIIFSRQSTIDRCLRYLATDTVCFCFPDEEEDRKLLRRQQKAWEPLLAWLRDDFGVAIAKPAHLLSTCENSPETLRKVAIILSEMDAFTLAGTLSLVLDLKSVITALALVFRHVTVEEACQASALEEAHQKAAWGHVDLYHELDETVLYSQVAAASTYLWLLDEDQLKVKELKRRIKARLRAEFPDSTPPDRD